MSPEVKANPQRVIVAAVQLPAVSNAELEASLKELRELARTLGFEVVDHEIWPPQARNLKNEIGCEVMDRTMVILEIFHRHARSNAAGAFFRVRGERIRGSTQ